MFARLFRSNMFVFLALPVLFAAFLCLAIAAARFSPPLPKGFAFPAVLAVFFAWIAYDIAIGTKRAMAAPLAISEFQQRFPSLDPLRAVRSAWKLPEFKIGFAKLLLFYCELLAVLGVLGYAIRRFTNAA